MCGCFQSFDYVINNGATAVVHQEKRQSPGKTFFVKIWEITASLKPVFVDGAIVPGKKMAGYFADDDGATSTYFKVFFLDNGFAAAFTYCDGRKFFLFDSDHKATAAVAARCTVHF